MRDSYRELAPLCDVMASDPGIQAFYAEFQASIRGPYCDRTSRPVHPREGVPVERASSISCR